MPRPLACSSRKERTDQLEGVPGGLAWPRGAGWGGLVAQGGACWAPTPCPASALTHSREPRNWQRPFRSSSPNSTRTREETRAQGPGDTQRTQGAALLPLRTVSPNPGEAPHPHHSWVQRWAPHVGGGGTAPRGPRSAATGEQRARGGPTPARQEAKAPPQRQLWGAHASKMG